MSNESKKDNHNILITRKNQTGTTNEQNIMMVFMKYLNGMKECYGVKQ